MIRNAIESNIVLKNTNPSAKEKLISSGVMRKYKKGEYIFREREKTERIYFVVSGHAVLYKLNRNLDKKVIFIAGPGEILNEVILEDSVASINCYALSEVDILSFSRKQLLEVMNIDFELTKMIIDSMSKKIRRTYRQLGNTSNMMCVEKQVAAKLYKLAKDFGIQKNNCTKIAFDMTITFLADMVGSKRETVSRIMKNFSDNKIAKIEKSCCYIYDIGGLKKIVVNE